MSDQPTEGMQIDVVYPVDEITEVPNTNGQLFKTVKREGKGSAHPPSGAKVIVHYVGTLSSDGSKFDSSRDRSDPFEFTIGQGQVIKGWDVGVATMKKGELAILKCLPDFAYGARGSPPKIPANSTLNFEVELLDWSKSEDVSENKDRSLMKELVSEGTGYDTPSYESTVTVDVSIHKVDKEDDGAPNAEWELIRSGFKFVVGETENLPVGLEQAVKSMKRDETAFVRVAASLVKNDDDEWSIQKGTPFFFKLKVHEFTTVQTWTFKGMDKVNEGMKRKDQGNDHFKAGRFEQAIQKYRRALEFVEHDYNLEEEEEKVAAKKVKHAAWGNAAQCCINTKNYVDAAEFCAKILKEDPNNAKAIFRQGKILSQTDEWDEAKRVFRRVLELDPGNGDAQRELAAVEEKIKKQNQKQKAAFSNMFEKLSKMEAQEEA